DPNQRFQENGPAQGVDEALNQGDLEKAQKEMQALADKLKKNELNAEERKQLEKQLDEMQKKLNDAAEQNQLKDKLQKDLADGKLTKEDFDKQMGKAGEQAEKMKDLKDIAKKLEESKDAMGKGDDKAAADKLGDAAQQLQKLDPKGAEMKQLQEAQQN